MIKFEETEHTDIFKLSIQKGTEIDGIYKCRLRICNSPTCQCGVIIFDLFPESELKNKELLKDIPIRFGIEIFEERIYSDAEYKILKNHKRFAKFFMKCFEADDWKDLRRLFLRYKTFITENLDPDLADPYFPMDEIEEYSAMVGYYEILPYAQVLKISVEDNDFILDDQYCVIPDCSCADTILTFIPVEKKSWKTEDYSNGIFVNYKDRKWKTKDFNNRKMPKTSELRRALEEKYPDIYKIFKKRHSTLRLLYKRFRKRKLSERKLSGLKKVGRNDPCPCGSGKKYKKCCLGK